MEKGKKNPKRNGGGEEKIVEQKGKKLGKKRKNWGKKRKLGVKEKIKGKKEKIGK